MAEGASRRVMPDPHRSELFGKNIQPEQAVVERVLRFVDARQRVPDFEAHFPRRLSVIVAGDPERRSTHGWDGVPVGWAAGYEQGWAGVADLCTGWRRTFVLLHET